MPERKHPKLPTPKIVPLCIKVLSGLQKDAIMPLKEGVALTIGSAKEANIILRGENIPSISLKIIKNNEHISVLHAENGILIGKEQVTPETNIPMYTSITVGSTTIAYGLSGKPWPSGKQKGAQLASNNHDHAQKMAPQKQENKKKHRHRRIFSYVFMISRPFAKILFLALSPLIGLYRWTLSLPLIGTLLRKIGFYVLSLLSLLKRLAWRTIHPFLLLGRWVVSLLWRNFVFLIINPLRTVIRWGLLPFRLMIHYLFVFLRSTKRLLTTTWCLLTYNKITKWTSLASISIVACLIVLTVKRVNTPPIVVLPPLIFVKNALEKQPSFAHLLLSYQEKTQNTIILKGILPFNHDINQLRRLVRHLPYPVIIKVRSRENIEAALSFFKERLPGIIETTLLPLGDNSVQLSIKGVLETSFLLSHNMEAMLKNEIPGVVSVLIDVIGTEELEKKSQEFLNRHETLHFVKGTIFKYHMTFSGAVLGNYWSQWETLLQDFAKTLPSPSFVRSLVHDGPLLDINVHSYTIGKRPFIRFSQGSNNKQLRNVPGDFITRNIVLEEITKKGLVLTEGEHFYYYSMENKKAQQSVTTLSQEQNRPYP